uniref:U106-Liphistoxin-Lsp1a_1 n=1 Tax=Liphistius sp. SGP-2016 TaxID=1905180 RepID=A0A4Q8K7R9_9ARAC
MMYYAVLILCIAVATEAFVCEEDYCDKTPCETIEGCEDRNGFVREKGSFCGCCDICVIKLDVGDFCIPNTEEPMGFIRTTECGDGLICDPAEWECIRVE